MKPLISVSYDKSLLYKIKTGIYPVEVLLTGSYSVNSVNTNNAGFTLEVEVLRRTELWLQPGTICLIKSIQGFYLIGTPDHIYCIAEIFCFSTKKYHLHLLTSLPAKFGEETFHKLAHGAFDIFFTKDI